VNREVVVGGWEETYLDSSQEDAGGS